MVHRNDPVLDPLHGPSSWTVSGTERSHWKFQWIAQHHMDMPETEGLARKRKVRAAHRGSVTRIVSQVYENLESGEALKLPRLRQQKSLLSGKLDVLSKLYDELIEIVAKDDLDNEVEQAHIIKEKISLCIMDIDQALEHASSHKVTDATSASGD